MSPKGFQPVDPKLPPQGRDPRRGLFIRTQRSREERPIHNHSLFDAPQIPPLAILPNRPLRTVRQVHQIHPPGEHERLIGLFNSNSDIFRLAKLSSVRCDCHDHNCLARRALDRLASMHACVAVEPDHRGLCGLCTQPPKHRHGHRCERNRKCKQRHNSPERHTPAPVRDTDEQRRKCRYCPDDHH